MRIIDPFGISEVIGRFVVQVWVARLLGESKETSGRPVAWYTMWEQTQYETVTKVSGEKFLNLHDANGHEQGIMQV